MATLGQTNDDWLARGARIGIPVLATDRGLESAVAADWRPRARVMSTAHVIDVPRASTLDPRLLSAGARGFGLLVLDGLLAFEVVVGRRCAADLLTTGDLVVAPSTVLTGATCSCRALRRARLAVLDRHWALRMSPYAGVAGALNARAVDQCRRVVAMTAITYQVHIEVRLWLLLWHLAERFGRVHPDGVRLDLPLTHDVLAELARARRPSVTVALAVLADRGVLRRERPGWTLMADVDAIRPRSRLPGGSASGRLLRARVPAGSALPAA